MKALLEEFGMSALVVMVLMVLIGVAVRSSENGGQQMEDIQGDLMGAVDSFVEEALSEMDKEYE